MGSTHHQQANKFMSFICHKAHQRLLAKPLINCFLFVMYTSQFFFICSIDWWPKQQHSTSHLFDCIHSRTHMSEEANVRAIPYHQNHFPYQWLIWKISYLIISIYIRRRSVFFCSSGDVSTILFDSSLYFIPGGGWHIITLGDALQQQRPIPFQRMTYNFNSKFKLYVGWSQLWCAIQMIRWPTYSFCGCKKHVTKYVFFSPIAIFVLASWFDHCYESANQKYNLLWANLRTIFTHIDIFIVRYGYQANKRLCWSDIHNHPQK